MTKKNWFQIIAFVLLMGTIFLYSFNQINEADPYYHIKVGEIIWKTGHVPTQDIFSYTAEGAKWVPHEWLAEIIFYLIYLFSGFWGLITICALIAVLTYFIAFKFSQKMGASFVASFFVFIAIALVNFLNWVPRPQVFSFVLFIVILYCLENFHRNRKISNLIGIAFSIWLWANMNASFVLGLALILAYVGAEILKKTFPKKFGETSNKPIIWLSLTLLFSAILGLINPAGKDAYLYGKIISASVKAFNIQEWLPITSYLQYNRYLFIGVLIFIGALLAVWRIFKSKQKDDLGFWLAFLGVSAMPFISVRHIGFWPIIAAPVFAILLSEFLKGINHYKKERVIFSASFTMVIILILFWWVIYPTNYVDPVKIPVTLVDFFQKEQLKGPIFNLYNEGMYLLFRFYPQEKVFLDGRSEVYDEKFRTDFFQIISAKGDWQKLIDHKYKVNCFILPYYPEPILRSITPLIKNLTEKNGWFLVYFGDGGMIYIRKGSQDKGIEEKLALHVINPLIEPKNLPQDKIKEASIEIKNFSERVPYSLFFEKYAKSFYSLYPDFEDKK